jgi:uncharacterized protein YsxB (DUF464 family)
MIRARVVLEAGGSLLSFRATGHAAAVSGGDDIVCAAFTVLARTAYRALEGLQGIEIRGRAPGPGDLSFEVLRQPERLERAAGMADFLVAGIGDLARDYPGAVEFVLERDWRE